MEYKVAKQPGLAHVTPFFDGEAVPGAFEARGASHAVDGPAGRVVWSFGRAFGRDVVAGFNKATGIWTYAVLRGCGSYARAAARKDPSALAELLKRQNVSVLVRVYPTGDDNLPHVHVEGGWHGR